MEQRTVTPYLAVRGAGDLIEFLQKAFGGELTTRHDDPEGRLMHAEVRLGDSMIMAGDVTGTSYPETPAALYIKVENTDAAYERAVAAGGISVERPTDKPYGRMAWIKDKWGNTWYLVSGEKG